MRNNWSTGELVLALDLYLKKPRCTRADPDVKFVADKIGRSVGSVYARLQNYKAVDPGYAGSGLAAGIELCRPIWDAYAHRLVLGESVDTILGEQAPTTWLATVRRLVTTTWREGEDFSLNEAYKFEEELRALFPENQHIKEKLRQILQELREEGTIVFLDQSGRYQRTTFCNNSLFPDEVEKAPMRAEGGVKKVLVNAFERNEQARKECIRHHGYRCAVCRVLFSDVYGTIGDGFIHVHHLRPLSSIGEEYMVDPIHDLVPVCPNCHAMLHRRNPPLTLDELRRRIISKTH